MLKKALSFLSLFFSLGTLVCCALPALFVSLGLGATFVSILGTFPQLIWLSEHKGWIFAMAGVLLMVTAVIRHQAAQQACPTEPTLAARCKDLKSIGGAVFYLSVACYLIGGFFAFVAPMLY